MIKVEHIEVFNFEGAIRGLRNPMNSWDKSDSHWCIGHKFEDCKTTADKCPRKDDNFDNDVYCVGKADLDLMKRLYNASLNGDNHAHRKYLRQIFVSMDIIAPDYFFKEFSTYKVGVVENSTSTMHRITSKEFELTDFSYDYDDAIELHYADCIDDKIEHLNYLREEYLKTKDKRYWRLLIQELPMSYLYRRTVTMNYENVMTIINQRSDHKLSEWRELCEILRDLPYIKEIRGEADEQTDKE